MTQVCIIDDESKVEKHRVLLLRKEEAKDISAIYKEVWPKAYEYPEEWREMRAMSEEEVKKEMDSSHFFFGVRINGKLVGVYKASVTERGCFGEQQAVLPEYSDQGVAVTLVAKEGKLVDVVGGRLIKHNLEKLPSPLELEKVLVKTASVIRRTKPKRVGVGAGTDERESQGTRREKKKKRACLFYNVDNLFPKLKGAEDADADVVVAVTIGDDTTSIAGDILKRFGICMIGITDGDADGLIAGIERGAALEQYGRFLPPDSLIIRLKPERDDIIGEKVKEEIFGGAEEIELDGDVEQQIKALKHRILHLAEQDIIGELSSPPVTTTT